MRVLVPILFLVFLQNPVFALPTSVRLSKGSTKVLSTDPLIRIAVGDSKVIHAKAIGDAQILLTAKKVGKTSLHIWTEKGEREVDLTVLEGEKRAGSHRVARVALQFIEFSSDKLRDLGVRWPSRMDFGGRIHAFGNQSSAALNFSGSTGSIESFVHLLETAGQATIVQRPEIYVSLGETAKFHSGGQYPVVTTRGSLGNHFQQVDWKPYGIVFEVTPESLDGLFFQSDLSIEVSDVDPTRGSGDIAGIKMRSFKTQIDSEDGQTILLSGLRGMNQWERDEGLPFLSRIPILGTLLFGQRKKQSHQSDLLMALTIAFQSSNRDWKSWESDKELMDWVER